MGREPGVGVRRQVVPCQYLTYQNSCENRPVRDETAYPHPPKSRYEGLAEWYDNTFSGYEGGETSSSAQLGSLLRRGSGLCLDVACGTGLHFKAIESTGRKVVGIDISADMLRVASRRSSNLLRSDATRLPFRNDSFPTVVCTYLHTDIEATAPVFAEVARVLLPGGTFVYLGVHPCFVGHYVERRDDGSLVLHRGYRETGWHYDSPFFGPGVRSRIGEYHLTLAELMQALLDSGLRLVKVKEPDTGLASTPAHPDSPWNLGLVAIKDSAGHEARRRAARVDLSRFSHAPSNYSCPLCEIVAGRDNTDGWTTQAEVVYRNDAVTAWINAAWWPENKGAVVIAPNQHFENIFDLPPHQAVDLQMAARLVSLAMKECYRCDGISTRQHNEPAGNQEVWHYHLHVFPRYEGDRLYERHKERRRVPVVERVEFAERLRPVIAKLAGEGL